MIFEKKTEEELASMNLWPEGIYDFTVIDAKDRVSKSGNEMIELNIRIWNDDNKERNIFDYLLSSMMFKLKHFCDATGLVETYESGQLVKDDCIGRKGKLHLIIQKDKTGQYGDRNSVKDYIGQNIKKEYKPLVSDPSFDDKDLPF